MRRVDQRRMRGPGTIDPGPGRLGAAGVQGDGDDFEAVGMKLISQFPPPGQIEAAPSPRRPRDHEHLRAPERPEREVAPLTVG
jgi:hypothetical protein